jgi:HemY protein
VRLLIGLVLTLAVAAGLTRVVQQDPGYALITYGGHTLETTLAVAAAAVTAVLVVVCFVARLVVFLYRTPRRLREWRATRANARARKELVQGLMLMAEGKWKLAERRLVAHANRAETPLLNFLIAARAAQNQGAYDRRDHYLGLAGHSLPAARLAVGLTQAELQYDHGQMAQALATLNALRQQVPHHPRVLRLLALTHERLGNWPELLDLVDRLARQHVFEPINLRRLEQAAHRYQLEQVNDAEELDQLWHSIPARSRDDTGLKFVYAARLMACNAHATAERLIRQALDREWDDGLCEQYGRLEGGDPAGRLEHAEKWLAPRPTNPTLLLTLGRIAIQAKLWGVARRFLEASVDARPSAEAYIELGNLLESLDETGQAMDCYRTGLQQTAGTPAARLRLKPAPLAGLAGHHHAPA